MSATDTLKVQPCTRDNYHEGPCNGWPSRYCPNRLVLGGEPCPGCHGLKWHAAGCTQPDEPLVDLVNKPPHYRAGGIECIEAILAALGPEQFIGYCRGNAIKYAWRAPHKGTQAQDFRKAAFYLERAAEVASGEPMNLGGSK